MPLPTQLPIRIPITKRLNFTMKNPIKPLSLKYSCGRCYFSFRGTNVNFADWSQNINLGEVNLLYKDDDETQAFCEGRAGSADFLLTAPFVQGSKDLQACYESCADPLDCLVVTGHSQEGATAVHASTPLVQFKSYRRDVWTTLLP
jgi:hypothetical protein